MALIKQLELRRKFEEKEKKKHQVRLILYYGLITMIQQVNRI